MKEHNFIWYSTRISFWIMIAIWILLSIINPSKTPLGIALIWVASGIFCFVVSIVHLTKIDQKAFAITSLVISSLADLLFLIGFIAGILA